MFSSINCGQMWLINTKNCIIKVYLLSCNTGGSDETPTLVGTGVPHRQRSQGGAVLTITADGQKGSVSSRISQEEMGTDVEVSGV